jgi:6-phospho-3-hexuloisomerase
VNLQEEYTKLWTAIVEEHKQVFERQDCGQVTSLIDVVCKKKRIFVMGVGREGIAARSFSMRLMHLGKEVHWIWDDTTPRMSKDDLFIVINGSGNIGHINYVLGQAKKTGAIIALVTGSPSGDATKFADYCLFVPAAVYNGQDPVVESIQPMGNLFEQHCFMLFDIIVMILEKQLKLSHDDMSVRHRNIE